MTRRKAPDAEEPLTRREQRAAKRALRQAAWIENAERTVELEAGWTAPAGVSAAPSTPKAPRPDDVHLTAEEYAELVAAGRPKPKKKAG